MKIIKKNGLAEEFNGEKIKVAIRKSAERALVKLTPDQESEVVAEVAYQCAKREIAMEEDTAVADGIDFYSLADNQFNVVVIKNGNRITYGDCIVTDVSEDGSLNDKVVEKMTISALTRKVG